MWKEGTARKLFISECGTVSRQLGATFQRTFKSIGLIWRHRQSWFFFSHFRPRPPHKASPYATPLKPQSSQTPNDCKIHLSSHFYTGIYYSTSSARSRGHNQFVWPTPKNDLQCQSFTPAQPANIKILFKRDYSFRSRTELLLWDIGALPILYRINMSTKVLLRKKLLQQFSGKFKEPLSKNNLPPSFIASRPFTAATLRT